MTDAEIEASKAPLMDHLIELRARLIKALAAFVAMFFVCFFFAKDIYNILLVPFEHVAGPDARLIYTAPQEYFFTQIRVAIFAAAALSCPVVFSQIYAFVAPGLYRHERRAFAPYLVATPIFFALRRAAGLFRRDAEPSAFLHRHAAGEGAGQAADRASAARQRISVADHDPDLRFWNHLSIAGDSDASRPGRDHRFRPFCATSGATPSCSFSSFRRC